MSTRQQTLDLTGLVRIILVVAASAAAVAWILVAVFGLGQDAVVLTVMTLAFLASWSVTNHRPVVRHRVTLVRVPARVR